MFTFTWLKTVYNTKVTYYDSFSFNIMNLNTTNKSTVIIVISRKSSSSLNKLSAEGYCF